MLVPNINGSGIKSMQISKTNYTIKRQPQSFTWKPLTGTKTTIRKPITIERLQDILTTSFLSQYVDLRTIVFLVQLLAAMTSRLAPLPMLDPSITPRELKCLDLLKGSISLKLSTTALHNSLSMIALEKNSPL